MLLIDVNILVYAQRQDLPEHGKAKAWLEAALNGSETVGIFSPTLASFLRIVTNRRIFKVPTALEAAFAFVDAVNQSRASAPITAGSAHWNIFERLS